MMLYETPQYVDSVLEALDALEQLSRALEEVAFTLRSAALLADRIETARVVLALECAQVALREPLVQDRNRCKAAVPQSTISRSCSIVDCDDE